MTDPKTPLNEQIWMQEIRYSESKLRIKRENKNTKHFLSHKTNSNDSVQLKNLRKRRLTVCMLNFSYSSTYNSAYTLMVIN